MILPRRLLVWLLAFNEVWRLFVDGVDGNSDEVHRVLMVEDGKQSPKIRLDGVLTGETVRFRGVEDVRRNLAHWSALVRGEGLSKEEKKKGLSDFHHITGDEREVSIITK